MLFFGNVSGLLPYGDSALFTVAEAAVGASMITNIMVTNC